MEENHNSITHGVQHPGIHRFASPKFVDSIQKKVGRIQADAQRSNNVVVLLYQTTRQHIHYNSVLLALFYRAIHGAVFSHGCGAERSGFQNRPAP